MGLLAPAGADAGRTFIAAIFDDDKAPSSADSTMAAWGDTSYKNSWGYIGSFLVRDSVTTVPVPASVWLMATGLLGLMGCSGKKNSQDAC